jgi:hypothetical protein
MTTLVSDYPQPCTEKAGDKTVQRPERETGCRVQVRVGQA